jgi:integrase
MGLLRLVWRVLETRIRSAVNPWGKIGRKRILSHSRRELTIEELQRVCQSASGEMRILFALGIYTGLRLGDCATLRWGETDVKRGIIRRIPMKTARRKGLPVTIPLHSVLRGLLAELANGKRGQDVLPETAALYRRDSGALSKRIQAHFRTNGIQTNPESNNGREKAAVDVGFHSLRHTFVSLCREANAPLSVVESIVGHSNPAMTRLYTHTSEAAAGAAVASLPDVTGQPAAKPALPAAAPAGLDRAAVRALAEKLMPENAKETRAQLLDLLARA